MILFPAIDLYDHKAVRLFKGDYEQMTVYSDDPASIAEDFLKCGASHIHLVDLEGAKSGETPNLQDVLEIKKRTGAFCEIGGGIRSMETVKRYLESGVDRVILGTAAVQDEAFLLKAVEAYKERIAVGADIRDGYIAVKGWLQKTAVSCEDFFRRMEEIGIDTVICTDISKDGAMQGTNRDLYKRLSETFRVKITASGGVSSLEDLRALKAMGLYAAIIGKAYYTGAVSLKEAVEEIE